MSDILRDEQNHRRPAVEYQFSEMMRTAGATVPAMPDRQIDQPSRWGPRIQAAPTPSTPAGQIVDPHRPVPPNPHDRETAVAALNALVERIDNAHQQWHAAAEKEVLQLAFALAERIVRRHLARDTDIPLDLVREALELAGRGQRLRVALHPTDYRVHQDEVRRLSATMHPMSAVEIVGDQSVERGGCVVETPDGLIDQTVSAQLRRIREELQA